MISSENAKIDFENQFSADRISKFATMIELPFEILIKITEFLEIQDALNLSVTCKFYRELLDHVRFSMPIDICRILDLPYFNSFTHVIVKSGALKFPAHIRIIDWCCNEPLPLLPESLIEIYFHIRYQLPLPQLPAGLKRISLDVAYELPLPKLPEDVTLKRTNYIDFCVKSSFFECRSDAYEDSYVFEFGSDDWIF